MNIELPQMIKNMLAAIEVRTYHHLWHLVRNEDRWNRLTDDQRNELINRGWQAPRYEGENGAGLDFLFMHREMIEMLDKHLHHLGDASYTKVEGWNPIPYDHNDSTWKMPPIWNNAPSVFVGAKSQAMTDHYRQRVDEEFRNTEWIKTVSLDELGDTMEWSIHGWMHLHWSEEPPADIWSESVENDWLGAPFSSHINNAFWKLHGFIDETISLWEKTNQTQADFSNAWAGPSGYLPQMKHTADPELLKELDVENKPILLMTWKIPVIEGVNEKETVVNELKF